MAANRKASREEQAGVEEAIEAAGARTRSQAVGGKPSVAANSVTGPLLDHAPT